MRDVRIVMLTTRFPPDYGGGARHALGLCHKLAARGVTTFVVTGHRGQGVVHDRVEGIPVTRLPLPRQGGTGVLPFYLRLLRLLLARRHDYDLIHAHAVHHHAYAGFLIGRLLGKPAIAKIALLGHDDPASFARRRLGRVQMGLIRQASTLVATSREMVEAVQATGWPADRLVYIPNGVDADRFCPLDGRERPALRRRLDLPEDAFVLLFVGLVVRRKGVDLLAQAWPQIRKAQPQAHLVLVGPHSGREHWGVDERYVAEVKASLAQGGDGAPVRFVGMVADPIPYLQAADLFVFPSRQEGMPNALLEAMACGLPFVATRLGCIEEMAPSEQRPYLVPTDDVGALAEAIISLARDANARRELSIAVRRTVETHFSLDAVADQYRTLYRQLLEERG